jgi:membrane-bound lytic murein transglycosylase D
MKRILGCLTLLGLAACARSGPSPVTPLSQPGEEQAAAPAAPRSGPVSPADPAAQPSEAAVAAPHTAADSAQEDAFLDSLRTQASDSTVRARTNVAPEVVESEATSMFGRPDGTAAAAIWDIDVASYASHDRVLYWMDYFTGRARWHFERYLERLGRYDGLIRSHLASAGLPQDLIYLAMIESGFNQLARSRAGAVGLWQFMPGTARRYGLTVDAWVDDRRDPYEATVAAARMLAELNNRFGSLWLAAAAYNSGPGKIQRGLTRYEYGALSGDDAYFALSEGRFLRRETRDYVPKLIAAALLAKEPDRYGFTGLARWTPLRYDSVHVTFAVGLDVVARLSGAPRDSIEGMNARFIRGVTPPDRDVWVRVPAGSADSVAARLAVLPARDRVTFVSHVVSRGETLSHISQRYGVSVADVKSANHLHSTRLSVGQRLIIPTSGARWKSSTDARPRRVRAASAGSSAGRSPVAATGRTAASKRVHLVRSGETLWSISRDFQVPLAALLSANGLTSRSVLHAGQAIRLPN